MELLVQSALALMSHVLDKVLELNLRWTSDHEMYETLDKLPK